MNGKVVITFKGGPCDGQGIAFSDRTLCTVGRATECYLRVASPLRNVSRRHCLIELDPPHATIRDLGSLNGTFVNGEKIGQRTPGEDESGAATVSLKDGDVICIGDLQLVFSIQKLEHQDSDGAWQPEEALAAYS